MIYAFNMDDIFEIAEQIERNGALFYRQMTEHFSETTIRQLFIDLAEMEEEHEKVFISMRADLSDRDKEPTIFDPDGESALYLRALADLRVFNEQAEKDFILSKDLSKDEKMRKVSRAAIGIEKESIVFYLGMKEFIPQDSGKKKVDDIIKEEMKHIRILGKQLFSLKG
ncbi:ferritin family protein [Thermodesulfobacteriota bacterium]